MRVQRHRGPGGWAGAHARAPALRLTVKQQLAHVLGGWGSVLSPALAGQQLGWKQHPRQGRVPQLFTGAGSVETAAIRVEKQRCEAQIEKSKIG